MEIREKYLEMASLQFQRYGIRSVTMDDLCKEFGISKKTLYQHFKDKRDLVESTLEFIMNKTQMCHTSVQDSDLNAVEKVINIAKVVIGHIKSSSPSADYDLKKYYPDLYKKYLDRKSKMIFEQISGILQQGITEGFIRSDINVKIIAQFQVGVIMHIFNPENEVFDTEPWSIKVYKELVTHYLYGVCNEKGTAMLSQLMKEFKTIN